MNIFSTITINGKKHYLTDEQVKYLHKETVYSGQKSKFNVYENPLYDIDGNKYTTYSKNGNVYTEDEDGEYLYDIETNTYYNPYEGKIRYGLKPVYNESSTGKYIFDTNAGIYIDPYDGETRYRETATVSYQEDANGEYLYDALLKNKFGGFYKPYYDKKDLSTPLTRYKKVENQDSDKPSYTKVDPTDSDYDEAIYIFDFDIFKYINPYYNKNDQTLLLKRWTVVNASSYTQDPDGDYLYDSDAQRYYNPYTNVSRYDISEELSEFYEDLENGKYIETSEFDINAKPKYGFYSEFPTYATDAERFVLGSTDIFKLNTDEEEDLITEIKLDLDKFENGSIDRDNGVPLSDNKKVRTKEYIQVSGGYKYSVINDQGYWMQIFEYKYDPVDINDYVFIRSYKLPYGELFTTDERTEYIKIASGDYGTIDMSGCVVRLVTDPEATAYVYTGPYFDTFNDAYKSGNYYFFDSDDKTQFCKLVGDGIDCQAYERYQMGSKVLKTISDIQDMTSGAMSRINQTANQISLEVENMKEGLKSYIDISLDGIEISVSDEQIQSIIDVSLNGIDMSISNLQGQYSTISTTLEGITETVNNGIGDISELKITADAITERVTSAEGNIGTLQRTANDITARVQTAEGDINQLRIDVDGIDLSVSDEQVMAAITIHKDSIVELIKDDLGDYSSLEVKIDEITAQVGDVEGNIASLQETATSITAELYQEGADGPVSRLQMLQNQINLEVYGYDDNGNLNTRSKFAVLQDSISSIITSDELSTKIVQTINGIELSANSGLGKSVLDITSDKIESMVGSDEMKSLISQTIDEISSEVISEKVSSEISQQAGEIQLSITTLEGNYSSIAETVDSIKTAVFDAENGNQSRITQLANSITQTVEGINGNYSSLSNRVDSIEGEVFDSQHRSKITQLSNQINLEVYGIDEATGQYNVKSKFTVLEEEISSKVAKNDDEYTELIQTAEALTALVNDVDDEGHSLKSKLTLMSDSIEQKVEKGDDLESYIKTTAENIELSSSSALSRSIIRIANDQINFAVNNDRGESRIDILEDRIETIISNGQSAAGVAAALNEVALGIGSYVDDGVDSDGNPKKKFELNAGLKVIVDDYDETTSMIKADHIAINGSTIDLNGNTSITDSSNHTILFANGSISSTINNSTKWSIGADGNVKFTSGDIAGWSITTSSLSKDNVVGFMTHSSTYKIQTGVDQNNSAIESPIRIYAGFTPNASSASTNLENAKFAVAANGTLIATDGIFKGEVYTSTGTLSGWSLGDDGIIKDTVGLISDSTENTYIIDNEYIRIYAGFTPSANNNLDNVVFAVTESGKLYATNALIKGEIEASSGKIGGWNIGLYELYTDPNDGISSNDGKYRSGMMMSNAYGNSLTESSKTSPIRFYAGFLPSPLASTNMDNHKFMVLADGSLYATNAKIKGEIEATSGSFSGEITANSGKIGGWKIDASSLYYSDSLSGSNEVKTRLYGTPFNNVPSLVTNGFSPMRFYAGFVPSVNSSDYTNDQYINSNVKFLLLDDGSLYANAVRINGEICTNSGSIAGWTIKDSKIYGSKNNDNTNISGISLKGIQLMDNASIGNIIFFGGSSLSGTTLFSANTYISDDGYAKFSNIIANSLNVSTMTINSIDATEIHHGNRQINLSKVTSQSTTTYTLKAYREVTRDSNSNSYINKIHIMFNTSGSSTTQTHEKIDITVYAETAGGFGGSQDHKKLNLTIPSGTSVGTEKVFTIDFGNPDEYITKLSPNNTNYSPANSQLLAINLGDFEQTYGGSGEEYIEVSGSLYVDKLYYKRGNTWIQLT